MKNYIKFAAVLALSASVHASPEGVAEVFAILNDHNDKRFNEQFENSGTMLDFVNNVLKPGSEELEEGAISTQERPLNGWMIPQGIKNIVNKKLGTFIQTKLTMTPEDLNRVNYRKLSIARDPMAPDSENNFVIYAGNNLVASFRATDI